MSRLSHVLLKSCDNIILKYACQNLKCLVTVEVVGKKQDLLPFLYGNPLRNGATFSYGSHFKFLQSPRINDVQTLKQKFPLGRELSLVEFVNNNCPYGFSYRQTVNETLHVIPLIWPLSQLRHTLSLLPTSFVT